jgi:hypothetical protein
MEVMQNSILGAVVVLGALCGPALAQDAGGDPTQSAAEARAKVRAACAVDQEKFCAGVERGTAGGMRACFQTHAAELSAPCQAARAARAAIRAKAGS